MASKIKLFSLEREDANPNFIGQVDAVDTKQYVSLRLWLEEFSVVDWPFNFWDVEDKYRMKGKLEGMTTVDPKVYVILCLFEDGAPYKSQHEGDVSIVFNLLDLVVGSNIKVSE